MMPAITTQITYTGYRIFVDGVLAIDQYHDKNAGTDVPVPVETKQEIMEAHAAEIASYYS